MSLTRRDFLKYGGTALAGAIAGLKSPEEEIATAGEEKEINRLIVPTAALGVDIIGYATKTDPGPGKPVIRALDTQPSVFSLFSGNTRYPDKSPVGLETLNKFVASCKRYVRGSWGYELLVATDYESIGVNRLPLVENPPDFRSIADFLKDRLKQSGLGVESGTNEDKQTYNKLLDKTKQAIAKDKEAVDQLRQIEEAGAKAGQKLKELGIDMVYGPMVDLVPDEYKNAPIFKHRTISGDPVLATLLTEAWVAGMQSGGIVCVLKHAPGFGESYQDPHHGRVGITLREGDLFVYARLAKIRLLKAVMVTHSYIALDKTGRGCATPNKGGAAPLPSSLNPYFINEFRKIVGNDVFLFSDGLGMGSFEEFTGESMEKKILCVLAAGLDVGLTDPPTSDRDNLLGAEILRSLAKTASSSPLVDRRNINLKQTDLRTPAFAEWVIRKISAMNDNQLNFYAAGGGMTTEEKLFFAMRMIEVTQRMGR